MIQKKLKYLRLDGNYNRVTAIELSKLFKVVKLARPLRSYHLIN